MCASWSPKAFPGRIQPRRGAPAHQEATRARRLGPRSLLRDGNASHEDERALDDSRSRRSAPCAPEDDPWERYVKAYIYAGRLVATCGRKMASELATERYRVCTSGMTAQRAAVCSGAPIKRGKPLVIPKKVERKVEDLCMCLRELKLLIFRFMVLMMHYMLLLKQLRS